MKFTDIFIRKPVLASVVSLMIFLVGLRSAFELNVRQYPELENAVITVTTVYVGADADLVQGFITAPARARGRERGGHRLHRVDELGRRVEHSGVRAARRGPG